MRKIISFGFKKGFHLHETIHMIDVRSQLPNPFNFRELREKTGLDPEIGDFIKRHYEAFPLWLEFQKKAAEKALKGGHIVAIGCVGGRHRSVYVAERLAKELHCVVEHREMGITNDYTRKDEGR